MACKIKGVKGGSKHSSGRGATYHRLFDDGWPQLVAAAAACKHRQGVSLPLLLVGVCVLPSVQLAGLVQVVKAAVSAKGEKSEAGDR